MNLGKVSRDVGTPTQPKGTDLLIHFIYARDVHHVEMSSKVCWYRTFSFKYIWQKVKLNIFLQILDILGFVLLM